MKKIIPIAAGATVSALLLWLAFRNADWRAMAAVFAGVRAAPAALVLLSVSAELAIRGVKWALLLRPARKVRTWDAARLETAALALNNVLPLRIGELARAAYGAEMFDVNLLTVLSTILVEKLLDITSLLALSAAAASLLGIAASLPGGWRAWAGLGAAALLLLALMRRSLPRRYPRLRQALAHLKLGLKALRSPLNAVVLFLLAALQWFMNALNYYWLARAFNLDGASSLAKSVLLSFTGAAASSAPGMPGSFGSTELAVSSVLSGWGVAKAPALAFAAAAHLLPFLIITASGLFFVYGMGASIGGVWARFSSGKTEGAEV